MNDFELSIKIAEKCGWTRMLWATDWRGRPMEEEEMWVKPGESSPCTPNRIPNYCNDLNAMHEAEATLNEEQHRTYFYHLFGSQRLDDGDLWKAVHTTARQRAEAFARVFNLI